MFRKYRFGNPIETEAAVQDLPVAEGLPEGWKQEGNSIVRKLEEEEIVYGLGETVRGMNKRGWTYTSNNSDDMFHTETNHSLYSSQNFLLIVSRDHCYGIFVDTPGIVTFDVGCTVLDQLCITLEDFDFDLYVMEDASALNIVHTFRKLTGRSYIPPKWAFGYGQSRWSYMSEDEIRDAVKNYREEEIPLDSVYLDIDYMDHYKDFTVNEETFPDLKGFASEMKEEGVHLVPIIDAGVKVEEGYSVYEEGKANNYFCKDADNNDFTAAVWPGLVHFPDFLKEETRNWFGNLYAYLLKMGIDGFWNDMNEPAVFYTPQKLKEVFEAVDKMKGKNLDVHSFMAFSQMMASITNNPEYYKQFYHEYKGRKIRHDKVHNIYGYYTTRAAAEAFARLSPDKRILLFSRSSYIGMHRYGGIWTGDNRSWWSQMLLSFQQMPALNMCGFLYSGSDIGGFNDDCTEDLMLRWLEMAVLIPLYRNHSALGTRRQELYTFAHKEWFRNVIQLRYALIPYLYSEFMKAALSGSMYLMPLSFAYPEDKRACGVEDQLLAGESIMLAPVFQQNAKGRYVYLPEEMKMLRFRAYDDYDEEILSAGDHYVKAELNETILFLRKGHALPLAKPAETVDAIDYSTIHYIAFEADAKDYELYNDDGEAGI